MKKYIILSIIISLFGISCQNKSKQNKDLVTQKEQIEKQIDSLHKILVAIDQKLEANKEVEIPQIEALKLSPVTFEHYIELQGNVNTDGNIMLVPEAMGKVLKIYKNEGDKVRKGQVIMHLDDSMLKNQISEIETQYELAKTSYERQKRLWKQKIGSEMAYLQAKTRKESLEKKLKTLQTQLDKMWVKAPLSGVIDDMIIKEGEMAAPQKPVTRIVNLKKVYVESDVSEKYLSVIKKGMPVSIEFPQTGKKINTKLSYVGNFIHPNNRTFKIRVNILNLDRSLKPNQTGNIKIKDLEKKQVLVLPLSLVQEDRKGKNFVFVLHPTNEKNIFEVQKKNVVLGPVYKDKVWVKSGLKAGDLLAVSSARGLTEGDQVSIEKMKSSVSQEKN